MIFKRFIFIEVNCFVSVNVEGYLGMMDGVKIRMDRDNGVTTYGRRYNVRGILLPYPSFIDKMVVRYYPYCSFIDSRIRNKVLRKRFVGFYV